MVYSPGKIVTLPNCCWPWLAAMALDLMVALLEVLSM
jgi:hypothetical protein